MLGISRAKRQVKKGLGIYKVTGFINAPSNAKRRLKRQVGYESELMKVIRFIARVLK